MSALGQKQTFAVQYVMSALHPKADMCDAKRDVRFVPKADIALASRLKGRQPRQPYLFFCFSLFYSFICRINTCGNLPPAITVFDMTVARNRASRSERHPITFGGPLVIPTGLRHNSILHLSDRRSAYREAAN